MPVTIGSNPRDLGGGGSERAAIHLGKLGENVFLGEMKKVKQQQFPPPPNSRGVRHPRSKSTSQLRGRVTGWAAGRGGKENAPETQTGKPKKDQDTGQEPLWDWCQMKGAWIGLGLKSTPRGHLIREQKEACEWSADLNASGNGCYPRCFLCINKPGFLLLQSPSAIIQFSITSFIPPSHECPETLSRKLRSCVCSCAFSH